MKKIYLVAGANGSGKSTVARVILPAESVCCVNPDDIACEMDARHPENVKVAAGREALRRIDAFLATGTSFAIETTLSGLVHIRTLKRAKELGYKTILVYIFVDSAEVCIARIAERVRAGGHYIPDADVHRRYVRSKRNFISVYAKFVDSWTLFYNGSAQMSLVAKKDLNGQMTIFSEALMNFFTQEDL